MIIVDSRELNGGIPKYLDRMGAEYEIQQCEVGDYILSDTVAVERKTIEDFLSTWLDRRDLFDQLHDLAQSYSRPLLMIEGDPLDIYIRRRINPKAVDGVLIAIQVSMRIPIIWSQSKEHTAQWLIHIAAREQDTEEKKHFSKHGKRSSMSRSELQEYIVSAVPDLGLVTARRLLEHFGSVRSVFCADRDELMKVPKVGAVTADKIIEIVGGTYE